MELKFECGGCGQRIACDTSQIGMIALCPGCGQSVTVPNPVKVASSEREATDSVGPAAAPADTSASVIAVRRSDRPSVREAFQERSCATKSYFRLLVFLLALLVIALLVTIPSACFAFERINRNFKASLYAVGWRCEMIRDYRSRIDSETVELAVRNSRKQNGDPGAADDILIPMSIQTIGRYTDKVKELKREVKAVQHKRPWSFRSYRRLRWWLIKKELINESEKELEEHLTKATRSVNAEAEKARKATRVAPEGIVYNVVQLSVGIKGGLAGIAPGTQLKVISKNDNGSLRVQAGDLVTDVPASAVTNDLDVATAIVEQARKAYLSTSTP